MKRKQETFYCTPCEQYKVHWTAYWKRAKESTHPASLKQGLKNRKCLIALFRLFFFSPSYLEGCEMPGTKDDCSLVRSFTDC